MLVIPEVCEERLVEAQTKAKELGIEAQLKSKLDYLGNFACQEDAHATRCKLYPDFAPYSFSFTLEKRRPDGSYVTWFNGGLIYHGPHDGGGNGGAPTYAVSLAGTTEPRWEIHT